MKKFLILLSTLVLSTQVHAAVIDFQSLEINNAATNQHGFTYMEDGFTLNHLNPSNDLDRGFKTFGTSESRYQGSTALYNNTTGGTTELVQTGGGSFSLFSIDLAELNGSGVANVTFDGIFSGGGSITQTFSLDGLFGVFETFLFAGFNDLLSVSWTQDSPFHQFDNITTGMGGGTSAVPVPAAIWLFGSALMGFVGLRRKTKVAA